jgi:hypothetical protein
LYRAAAARDTMIAMFELPATSAGVVITIGIAALLAAATGATVKVAGNELGATTFSARILTGALGAILVAWSAWSLREKPFRVTDIAGTRTTIVETSAPNRTPCVRAVEVSTLIRFDNGPGTVRFELRLDGLPPKVVTQKIPQKGSGFDFLGPTRVELSRTPGSTYRLAGRVFVGAPNFRVEPIRPRTENVPPCPKASRP